MKKIRYIMVFLMVLGSILNIRYIDAAEENKEDIIDIDREFNFKKAKKEAKEKEYQKFDDQIHASKMKDDIKDMEYIKVIESEKDYIKFINETNDQAKIIYLGFDDCPFCKAFLPKLHAIAEDYETNIYYYDIHERQADASFTMVIEKFYKINKVPHAFIVKDSKIQGDPLNSKSSMQDMETFIQTSLEE